MNIRYALVLTALFANISCSNGSDHSSSTNEAWNNDNAPEQFGLGSVRFADLPREGTLSDDKYPWSGDYWSTRAGGISKRWQGVSGGESNYKDFQYDWLTGDAVHGRLGIEQLSPAEKYDILMGNYDFPLAKHERKRQEASIDPQSNDVPNWFGLCHGWAPATLMEKEPGALAVMTNPDGIEVPFYASDIKALVTKIYADYPAPTRFLGTRCNRETVSQSWTGRIQEDECRDTNPGAFHIVLAQMLGNPDETKRNGFVMDMTATAEVWNQPVSGFRIVEAEEKNANIFDTQRTHRAPGTDKLVHVTAEVAYITEMQNSREPQMNLRESYTKKMVLQYTLELDSEGRIIGGEWKRNETHPDFIYMLEGAPQTGDSYLSYDKVREILEMSLVK